MLKTFSYSALNTFDTCPRKFKFAYLEKIEVPKRLNAETHLGNVVHRIMRRLYQLGNDGVLLPEEAMLEEYHKQWDSVDREQLALSDEFYAVDDFIRMGEQMLRKHYKTYQPFNRGTLLGTEMHLTFSHKDISEKFRGYIDRLWKRDDGTIEICDYKTGRHLIKPSDKPFLYQMGIYQLAVGQAYPQFEQIELAQYFLRMDEVVRYRFRPDEIEALTEELRLAVIQIHEAARLDSFPTQEGTHCRYCEYEPICPAKRHRQMLDKESDQAEEQLSIGERAKDLVQKYLELYRRNRADKAELEALKADMVALAKEANLSRFDGDSGHVNVRITQREKFVTKTENASAFAELTSIAKSLGLEDYFNLDANALMKDVYNTGRLTDEQRRQMERFVTSQEDVQVRAQLRKEDKSDADSDDAT